ncbi:carboxypeptidase-like regulatory domain-containing protein [Chitinophaga sp.]|uniref:carboxypeptidase-like regulatory domain-containing protein n=1 Tax=Chitinophaga sp. TaxID=1869181 RepID=UPI0031D336EE
MKKLTISIPEPCTVPLQNMTPMPGGRYCSSCQKQVIDFTGMTDQQMMAYFEKHQGCCGSLLPSQLDREIVENPGKRWMPAAILAGVLALVMPESGKGQIKLTGIVHDSSSCDPLMAVTVLIVDQQGQPTRIGTATQEDGTFSLSIPDEYQKGVKLSLRYVGYEPKEIIIPEQQLKAKQPVYCELKMSAAVLGGISVVYVKSSWWKRLKYKLFR